MLQDKFAVNGSSVSAKSLEKCLALLVIVGKILKILRRLKLLKSLVNSQNIPQKSEARRQNHFFQLCHWRCCKTLAMSLTFPCTTFTSYSRVYFQSEFMRALLRHRFISWDWHLDPRVKENHNQRNSKPKQFRPRPFL